ncbi:MAG TPA: LLM class flavin-dependent oxidoreductase [Dehalococcoidia bacterium]|nr:LLM class flavin-dependent oxidoreductase [Dehalococcoidia bacterium]
MPQLKFGAMAGGEAARQARHLEDLGYESLWVGGHIVFYGPMPEQLTQLAALAMTSERATIGTNVLVLPLYHPTIVAKQIATIDHLSHGRVILGVGVGGEYAKEYEAVEVPREQRGSRANEGIELIRKLWTGEPVSHHGKHYNLEGIRMQPPPVQQPGPPIWVGGRSEAAARRCGRYGDGYIPYMVSIDHYPQRLATIRETAEANGRDAGAIERAIFIFGCLSDDPVQAADIVKTRLGLMYNQSFEGIIEKYCIYGTAEQCVAGVERFAEAGVQHFVIAPMPAGEADTSPLDRWMTDVFARFRS